MDNTTTTRPEPALAAPAAAKPSRTDGSARHGANRLAREKSPYLLQHQHNPVDWQAWGEEAFRQARSDGKPIFLSIGYSTCHWCHVMERESFENEETAAFLNGHFVSIKVDREERPDVDRVYMTFVQATTGQGGWPLTAFLTPDLRPFFGATYFPPEPRQGRPGFLQVLRQIQQVWQTRQPDLEQSAAQMLERLQDSMSTSAAEDSALSTNTLRRAGEALQEIYDPRHGGFGGAPKFPQPSQPAFLLGYAKRFKDRVAPPLVLHTCDRMAAGGIHDQLGGGFARYAVDAEWLVPHFEKMLYDNAQLAHLYLDAALVSGDSRHTVVVRDILEYVRRDMTHPEGGFFSAEDADSEGHEGKFYCWTKMELGGLLTAEEFNVSVRYFGITEQGNFLDHSHPAPLPGQNVLHIAAPVLESSDLALLASAKEKMLAARARRSRPQRDDKVLASWNGLMLGAFARAATVLRDETFRATAQANLAFLQTRLWDPASRSLYHRWREGEHDTVQLLAAYAFLLSGVVDFYEATLESKSLDFAITLAETLIARFFDAAQGGFWQSLPGTPDLILQFKDDYDGAEPSGNSVATLALLRLGKITGRAEFTEAAEKTLRFFADRLERFPQALPVMLQALDLSLGEPFRVVVAGDPGQPETRLLLQAVHSVYQPNKFVLGTSGAVESFARSLPVPTRDPVVYLCSGTACQAPTSDPTLIRKFLAGES